MHAWVVQCKLVSAHIICNTANCIHWKLIGFGVCWEAILEMHLEQQLLQQQQQQQQRQFRNKSDCLCTISVLNELRYVDKRELERKRKECIWLAIDLSTSLTGE